MLYCSEFPGQTGPKDALSLKVVERSPSSDTRVTYQCPRIDVK